MDQRERVEDQEEALRTALDGRQAMIWTGLPGIISSYDPVAMTAVVLPAVQAVYRDPQGQTRYITLPLLQDCPVIFPFGASAGLTFPIETGDDCYVSFSSRCIDAWWQSGAVQPPAVYRMHDLSDGFVFVGPRSQPKTLTAVSATKLQIRNKLGTTIIELDPDTESVNIIAPGGATIDADVTINGSLHVTGPISSDTDVIADTVSLKNHVHSGVTVGAANTGAPVP